MHIQRVVYYLMSERSTIGVSSRHWNDFFGFSFLNSVLSFEGFHITVYNKQVDFNARNSLTKRSKRNSQ